MLHLLRIDLVVVLVGADPLDPNDRLLEVHGYDQAIVVSLGVEHDPIGADDAGGRITPLHVGGAGPLRLAHLREPGVQRRLKRRLVLVAGFAGDELAQGAPRNDPH